MSDKAVTVWWHQCPDSNPGCGKEGWPEGGERVLVSLWPWRAGEPCYVTDAGFYWEGKDGWRPTFRGHDGDKFKNVYAWAYKPAPAEMSESLRAAIEARP